MHNARNFTLCMIHLPPSHLGSPKPIFYIQQLPSKCQTEQSTKFILRVYFLLLHCEKISNYTLISTELKIFDEPPTSHFNPGPDPSPWPEYRFKLSTRYINYARNARNSCSKEPYYNTASSMFTPPSDHVTQNVSYALFTPQSSYPIRQIN